MQESSAGPTSFLNDSALRPPGLPTHHKETESLTLHSVASIESTYPQVPGKAGREDTFIAPCAKNFCVSGTLLTGSGSLRVVIDWQGGVSRKDLTLDQAGLELIV